MNIAEFIKTNENLNGMHFGTVYQTILVLIGMGLISMDDLVNPVIARNGVYKNIEKE
jgi:hypothetical protein